MRSVFKYPLKPELWDLNGYQAVQMPFDAEVLTARWQNSHHGTGPSLWAKVDPLCRVMVTRYFALSFTGSGIPENAKYIGTIESPDGLVWHVWESAD